MASRPRKGRLQNYLIVWADGSIDEKQEDCKDTLAKLRRIVHEVNICATPAQCIDFLSKMDDDDIAFVISSGLFGKHLAPMIHDMPQLDVMYIFCCNKARHEQWTKNWPKIEGVYTSITPICESLETVVHQRDHNSIPMSFVAQRTLKEAASNEQNQDQLPPSYMYTMLFKQIILEIDEDDTKAMENLVEYCHNKVDECELTDFQKNYCDKTPVEWYSCDIFLFRMMKEWYSCDIFLFRMMNRALWSFDMKGMYKTGFFIRSLHRQLEELYAKQATTFKKEFIVYRGQGFTEAAFQHLKETKGGLVSFDSFLSTSKEKCVALEFVKNILPNNQQMVGVLFFITIDPSKISTSNTPFALIDKYSRFPEEQEILFSMHTVFRVGEIKQSKRNNRIWKVQLTFTDDNDPQLADLTARMKDEMQGSTGWLRMGKLMLQVGDLNQAEELYNELLKKADNDIDRGHIYHQLGWLRDDQGKYKDAVTFYEKSLEIKRKTLPDDHFSLGPTYTNLGVCYKNMGDYLKALEYHHKDLEISKKTHHADHPDLAPAYNNIGSVYDNMGDYPKALEYYNKAYKVLEKTGPENHPTLASTSDNIGTVYNRLGDYLKALEHYMKALEIRQKALPENHRDFATSYNNIALVHNNMGDYSDALQYYKKALEIREKALPENHPLFATFYSNIAQVYNNMGDHSNALQNYKEALEIREKALWENHPDLAASYNDIASVYHEIGDYTAALKALENTLRIRHKIFPEGNQAFASMYSWFGRVYRSLKDYSKSLEYFEKCLKIIQQTLPEKHPNIAITYSNVGDVYRLMKDYESALKFHRKALDIQENAQCNPLHCATTYNNLGETYREMKDYSTALTCFQKVLEIREKKLPKKHPDLAGTYHNMSKLYLATREYSMAMKYVQQAVEIAQETLPSTHPHIFDYQKTFEDIRRNI